MLRSYLRLALFAFGLLLGVQVPGFIDDYGKRVEARRLESQQSLKGFQDTAQKFFKGDMDALVAHYRVSDDPVMRSDAQSVAHLVQRSALLEREWQAMQGPWYAQAWHLATGADRDLLGETLQAYRYQVLFTPEAILWGVICALLLAWLAELLVLLFGWMLGAGRIRRTQQRHWR
ncbi:MULTISPECIES: DUF2937 family protein [Pseudomonadaceae]|jgi:hypothetical protein|uniref:DUF2937 family protein n=1 Tax=Ectopseudomonas hydrolytica TaxID=2493633 RepID=A0ABY5ACI6_9GAMM|nr:MULTISPECIES: DUF2937 family protein [Pseudomonas]EJO93662.1 hypothetical protein A471_12968 [Pseudomonas mendocina DLHK]MBF8161316.1 DUF2937 family protein [Pseudomonas mendocina]MBA4243100.1 DUF2937 domain-containing protein [Pseudomonas sp.]MDH0098128.1 DUF2937 family protein [Pseudomonas sp. GD04158]USR41457.1 DUF2937 family protein [Pseudomonas hydrolytica]